MDASLSDLLTRIAAALERLAPPPPPPIDLAAAEGFVWQPARPAEARSTEAGGRLLPVPHIARVPIDLIRGVDQQKRIILENTERFARGFPANNAMLWGARGMGKSSLVKAAHGAIAAQRRPDGASLLKLIEIHRDDLKTLPDLLNLLRGRPERCVILCDDLSFEREDADYKALKSVLDGGIEGRPGNVLFYATSNRRHLMPREMIDNERSTAINPGEAVEEKVSLSDRFGLWIGFHNCDQPTFFAMVEGYAEAFRLPVGRDALRGRRGRMVGHAGWPFGARRLAVHPGSRRTIGCQDGEQDRIETFKRLPPRKAHFRAPQVAGTPDAARSVRSASLGISSEWIIHVITHGASP